jgi:SAM-dependent methyltransferase
MITESQDERYFARMASSLGDKMRILDYLKRGDVLDIGAGSGELAETIRLAGNEVWALDGSSEAIRRIQDHYPLVNVVEAYSYEVLEAFKDQRFDTIVCSSVLHEVFSYGTIDHEPFSKKSVIEALEDFMLLLKPGGRLIIRDGVIPDNGSELFTVKLKSQDSVEFLEMYRKEAPFYGDRLSPVLVEISNTDNPMEFEANGVSVMEFLYTLTWGWDSAIREVQEIYGFATESEYSALLENLGYEVEYSEQYLQAGYVDALFKVTDIFDTLGNKRELPSSNMLLVARRP